MLKSRNTGIALLAAFCLFTWASDGFGEDEIDPTKNYAASHDSNSDQYKEHCTQCHEMSLMERVPFGLKVHIDHLAILIHGSPQIMLLALNLHEDFVNVEGIAVAQVESVVEPDSLGPVNFSIPSDDFWNIRGNGRRQKKPPHNGGGLLSIWRFELSSLLRW
jgi:hypothetical protein